jgi:hypothetical protein
MTIAKGRVSIFTFPRFLGFEGIIERAATNRR